MLEDTRTAFIAGAAQMRAMLADFVEVDSPTIANSIRNNWFPQFCEDPGVTSRANNIEEAIADMIACDICDRVVHVDHCVRPNSKTDDIVCSQSCADTYHERYR